MGNKKSSDTELTIEEKFRSALRLILEEQGNHTLSVSAVCKLADVSRANIYIHYPELIAEVREISKRGDRRPAKKDRQSMQRDFAKELIVVKREYKALLLVCMELQSELVALRKRKK